tara:strand:+ start:2733 stop:2921 length:189 start_codon:yes stop_codon:yes gene_type:complete
MENLELFKIETSLRDTLQAQKLAADLQLDFKMEFTNVFTFKSENHFFTFMDELEMRNLEFEV